MSEVTAEEARALGWTQDKFRPEWWYDGKRWWRIKDSK